MEKKVLVPVAQGVEEMESITIIDVLRRAGADVTVASVDEIMIQASKGIQFKADTLIDQCRDKEFDLVALPGGIPGAENLRDSKALEEILKNQAKSGRLYAAICASPAVVLYHHGLITPGKVTCFPSFTGVIDNGNTMDANVVVDGNCITSRGAGTACEYALTLVELLFSAEKRKEVEQGLAIL